MLDHAGQNLVQEVVVGMRVHQRLYLENRWDWRVGEGQETVHLDTGI